MSNINDFSFSEWLSSKRAVSFALAVGIIFLFTNYSGVLNNANPDAGDYRYPPVLIFILSHVDSFFFGLVTAILLFQASKEWQKIMYCGFEAMLIFLNLNRNFITDWLGVDSQFFLGSYIAVFSGVSFYFLGSLARYHREQSLEWIDKGYSTVSASFVDTPQNDRDEENRAVREMEKKTHFLEKYADLADDLREGLSLNKAARKHGVSYTTVQKVKLVMQAV
ncbi:MAG: hypothetical protein HC880_00680 [Bacteroidia bacterium]|nr:hypothetical protein [Bacteroidia bacterium]